MEVTNWVPKKRARCVVVMAESWVCVRVGVNETRHADDRKDVECVSPTAKNVEHPRRMNCKKVDMCEKTQLCEICSIGYFWGLRCRRWWC